MAFRIIGTPGCKRAKGVWTAYVPVDMNDKRYFLTLDSKDAPLAGEGKFNLLDTKNEKVAECSFLKGHKYMHVYQNLRNVIEKAMREDKEIESKALSAAVIVTKDGFEEANERNFPSEKKRALDREASTKKTRLGKANDFKSKGVPEKGER